MTRMKLLAEAAGVKQGDSRLSTWHKLLISSFFFCGTSKPTTLIDAVFASLPQTHQNSRVDG